MKMTTETFTYIQNLPLPELIIELTKRYKFLGYFEAREYDTENILNDIAVIETRLRELLYDETEI